MGIDNRTDVQAISPVQSEHRHYYVLPQCYTSNKLVTEVTRPIGNAHVDLYGNAVFSAEGLRFHIRGYRELMRGVTQSAVMLLDILLITAAKNGLRDTLVSLPLSEYMQIRGLTSRKDAMSCAKLDLQALDRISFEYLGRDIRKGEMWQRISISGGRIEAVEYGNIAFRFGQDFFDLFCNGKCKNKYSYMYMPCEALKGNTRHLPYKYWFGRRIALHKRMNIGKGNENKVSVKTLITNAPNYPDYERIRSGTDRHITERILDVFERCMNALGSVITWDYAGAGEVSTYKTFITAVINAHWQHYPYTTNLALSNKSRGGK